MKIAVIGTGYVGLVAGTCFADVGHHVTCVDTDPAKVKALRQGRVPIHEPGLEPILQRSIRERRLTFTTEHAEAVPGCQVVFIAVGTPEGDGGVPNLTFVERAVRQALAAADGALVLVMKSTVPVGTAAVVGGWAKEATDHPVEVVSNPEFLKEADAVNDFLRPDRVVIGTDSDAAWEVMETLYEPFVLSGRPILRMTNVAAELTKYAANAMLATRISFVNEIARVCDAVGADVRQVVRGMGADSRIGPAFLHAGCGYGGSCFPKDTQGLIHVARAAGVHLEIAPAVERVNDRQKELLVERVVERFGEALSGKRFALWGLAFKPRTDDVREAPALTVARGLLDRGASVVGTDPEALATFPRTFGRGLDYESDPYEAAENADALVLCTEWHEYRTADFERLARLMRTKVVFDGRNVLDPDRARAAGFEYVGIGRGGVVSIEAPQAAGAKGPRAG